MTKRQIEYNNEYDNNNEKQFFNFIEYNNQCDKRQQKDNEGNKTTTTK